MASRPPGPMSGSQKAGSAVASCPFAPQSKGQKKRARQKAAKSAQAKPVPCDLNQITVGLTTKSGGVSLTNGKAKAAATPVKGVSAALNTLLASHAVVIHYVAPATDGGGASARDHKLDEQEDAKIEGDAVASATMKSNCGQHPTPSRDPADGDGPPTQHKLEVETKNWELQSFLKYLWGKGSLADLVYGAEEQVTFTFDSCGLPASGPATTSLTGLVQLAIADEWQVEFRWAEGFRLSFSDETKHIRDLRDGDRALDWHGGSHAYENKREYADSRGTETEHEQVEVTKAGVTIHTKGGDDDGHRGTSIEADARSDDYGELSESLTARLKQAGDALEDETIKRGLALTIARNGIAVFDTDELGEIIENVQEFLQTGKDLYLRLVWLLENGARAGLPVSLTMKLEIDLKLLQGRFHLRAWPEAQAVKQTATYYLADYRKRFQVGASGTFADVELTYTITFQAKVLHEWVAAVTLEVEAQFTGTSSVDFTFANGVAAPDRKMGGTIGASVKASGEGSAASFYIKVEGEAEGGIEHDFTVGFDKLRLVNPRHHVHSDAVTFQASVRRGNKIWDFIGMGSGEPSWQWPEDEPFEWLAENALDKTW